MVRTEGGEMSETSEATGTLPDIGYVWKNINRVPHNAISDPGNTYKCRTSVHHLAFRSFSFLDVSLDRSIDRSLDFKLIFVLRVTEYHIAR
jgi:hypothetical protein